MATITSVGSGNWSVAGTWDAGVPNDDDVVVIAAGHNVLMDADLSAFTGLRTVTIQGGATPGMLYFKNGTNGHLKIRTGYNLVGTTSTNRGRLLANSDGVWATTTPLQFSNKAIIDLQGTAKLDVTNLDRRLRTTHPTNWMVHTYGTKYEFNAATAVTPATDVIDLGVAPPSAGTAVTFVPLGGATLPTGIILNGIYYIRAVSGNTCKVAHQNSDATIADITAVGAGTVAMLTGYASGSATVNVLQDVTADTPWVTTAGHNRVVLVDSAPESYDQQRLTLTTINAATLVLSAAVDSAQFPGARVALCSRNVSIISNGTTAAQPIIDFTTATYSDDGSIFDCEIGNTAGTGTTFYGYGINAGVSCINSGVIWGCSNGINSGSGHTNSGSIFGCSNGINSGSEHTNSGSIFGCYNGISYGSEHTNSGSIFGCYNGIYSGSGHTNSGSIFGCYDGISYGSGHTNSGSIFGCYDGIIYGSGHTNSGSIFGCYYGIIYGSGLINSGIIRNNTIDFYFPVGKVTMKSGSVSTMVLGNRNVYGTPSRISWENYNGTIDAYKATDAFGDVMKTACNGAGDAPSVDPGGGNGNCIEASSIQSNCSTFNPLLLFDGHRIWLAKGTHTITYKVQTTYSGGGGISAGNLKLTARYISEDSPLTMSEQTHAPAVAQRGNAADWTQTLAVTITTDIAGWVDLKMELMEYEANNEVYVWPTPVIS